MPPVYALGLAMILLTGTAQGSGEPQVRFKVTQEFPSSLDSQAELTFLCTVDGDNEGVDLERLMEISIASSCDNAPIRKLASINFFTCEPTLFGNNPTMDTEGELAKLHGFLKLQFQPNQEDIDIEDYRCAVKYLYNGTDPKMITKKHSASSVTLFNLMAKQNNELKTKLSAVEEELSTLKEEVVDLKQPSSCNELRAKRVQSVAEREIVTWPDGTRVMCDTESDGGGWTVFQRRVDGNVSFYRGWDAYERGFGTLDTDFWLGFDNLGHLMESGPQELRVDFSYNGQDYFAYYTTFSVGDISTNYKILLSGYSGSAGDSMAQINNRPFSTFDADHDTWANNCAERFSGAWWYSNCGNYANLNGLWGTATDRGMSWYAKTTFQASVTFSEMKTRPRYWG